MRRASHQMAHNSRDPRDATKHPTEQLPQHNAALIVINPPFICGRPTQTSKMATTACLALLFHILPPPGILSGHLAVLEHVQSCSQAARWAHAAAGDWLAMLAGRIREQSRCRYRCRKVEAGPFCVGFAIPLGSGTPVLRETLV